MRARPAKPPGNCCAPAATGHRRVYIYILKLNDSRGVSCFVQPALRIRDVTKTRWASKTGAGRLVDGHIRYAVFLIQFYTISMCKSGKRAKLSGHSAHLMVLEPDVIVCISSVSGFGWKSNEQ